MPFFKDDAALKVASVATVRPITALPPIGTALGRLARTHNAVGGLIAALGEATGTEPMAVLAVWYVESGGKDFVAGKPILRFEVHKFWRYWGSKNAARFDRHFRFGGHGADAGKGHQGHRFRAKATSEWRSFHGTQGPEYEVFEFACALAGKDAACMSASYGGPQIMGFNHDACGYASAEKLFDAFAADPRWQVLGFFDFCRAKGLIPEIRNRMWIDFGQHYNGDGAVYGPLLAAAYALKGKFEKLPRG